MNTITKNEIPDYSHTMRKEVPDKFKWKLDDIYPHHDAWEKDKDELKAMLEKIPETAKGWTDSPAQMLTLLTFLDGLEQKETALYVYAHLLSDGDMGESQYRAMQGEIEALSVKHAGLVTFIKPDILKLGKAKIDDYISLEPGLKVYEFPLHTILRMKKHILSSDKAGIVSQTHLFSGATGKASSILNDLDMPSPRITLSDGKRVRLNVATYQKHRGAADPGDRRKVMRTFWNNHSKYRNTHATLLDGAIKTHLFNARVHRFENCLEAALYPKNIDSAVYLNLIEAIKENLTPLHRYLKLKARMLKLDKMNYDDIYASSVPTQETLYPFETAVELLMESLKPLGPEYLKILEKGLNSGWTDLYPNKGKRSGAYSQGGLYHGHPYVLMNYNGKFHNVSTLTHEFGHALHSWFSNTSQPYPIADYPIFLAEIASTFNETLLVLHMLETEKEDLTKLFILDQYLDEFRGTLYRQTLFADFELAMHQQVEKDQTLTADWLDQSYLNLTRRYYGHKEKVVNVPSYIKNEWSGIPHFYYNFYVYQYATGIIASTALADMVLNGGTEERERYLTFLKSGGKQFPLDTLKEAGVDLTDPQTVKKATDKFDDLVTQMDDLCKKLNL